MEQQRKRLSVRPRGPYSVTSSPWLRRACSVALIGLVSACTTLPPDLGRSDVDALVRLRGLPVVDGQTTDDFITALIAAPLTVESSIRIALVKNARLKAAYARLGFAAAEVYAAGRISNPRFSGAFLDSNAAGELMQISLGLAISFTDLLTLPARQRLAAAEFAHVKQSIGAEVLDLAAQTQADYHRFVAAKQVAALRQQTARAAELSAALAGQFHAAGNLSARNLALERAAASEAQLIALEAEVHVHRARAEFGTTLGLTTGLAWDAPAHLPLPVKAEDDIDHLLELAASSRLDLAAARSKVDLLADRLGVTNWTRWLGDIQFGVETERETDGARLTGPTIGIEIPIFSQNRDAVLRAEAELTSAIAAYERILIDVENSVRLAGAEVANARARIAEYRDVLVPQRVAAVARAQEEVNFMLIGIFELIASKQAEYDAYHGYIEVVAEYWLARTELSRAVNNALPSSLSIGQDRLNIETTLLPRNGSPSKAGHDGGPAMNHTMHSGKEGSLGAEEPVDGLNTGAPSAMSEGQGKHHNSAGETP